MHGFLTAQGVGNNSPHAVQESVFELLKSNTFFQYSIPIFSPIPPDHHQVFNSFLKLPDSFLSLSLGVMQWGGKLH